MQQRLYNTACVAKLGTASIVPRDSIVSGALLETDSIVFGLLLTLLTEYSFGFSGNKYSCTVLLNEHVREGFSALEQSCVQSRSVASTLYSSINRGPYALYSKEEATTKPTQHTYYYK